MPHPTDGGRWDRPCHRPESRDTLPCENDQAKPDRFSRLARSTLLSKILESGPPKRCPWDRGLFLRIGVLELNALLACLTIASGILHRNRGPKTCGISRDAVDKVRQHFCANFSKVSNFPSEVKPNQP